VTSRTENRTPTIAALHRVTKRYGPVTALHPLDLALDGGRVTALLGPNGAGKTTAVRLLLGLTAPTAGTVSVLGGDPRDARTRTRVGAMLQVAKVPETLRVREHVDLFRSYYPAPLSYAEVSDAAGLRGLERRPFGTLSGGERQRVLFALAVCGDPDLLVLDEPTVGLDVESRRALWDRVRDRRAAGRAVLLTTHYLDEADALADRVVLLARGRVVADGTPAQMKARVAGRRVRCVTALPLAAVAAIPGVASARRVGGLPDGGADAVTEISTGAAEDVVRRLLAGDPALSGLEVTGAGLEDAFLTLTGDAPERPDVRR
jgi:ABC-2 type transport system ATP-binding protein